MLVFTPHLVCALLLPALFSADTVAPHSSECDPQEIPNMAIDISNAVAKGARFTDPLKVASVEECVSACCSTLNGLGYRTCNLALFNTQRSNGLQNCYLFLCPEPESCPMSPSPGVLSYSFWTVKEKSNQDSTKEDLLDIPKSKKVQNTSGKKSSPVVQTTVTVESDLEKNQHDKQGSLSNVHSPSKTSEVKHINKEDKANMPDHITSQLLHLANDIDKQLEKMEASFKEAKNAVSVKLSVSPTEKSLVEPTISYKHKDLKKPSSDAKDTKSSKIIGKKPETLEVYYPTPELITSTQSVRTSHQMSSAAQHPTTTTRTTVIPSTAPPKENKVAKKAPNSSSNNAKVLSSHNSTNSSKIDTTVKNMQAGHILITTQVPTTSAIHQAKSALLVTRHNPSRTSLLKAAESTVKDGFYPLTSKNVQETDRSVPELTALEKQHPSSRAGDTKDDPQHLDALDTVPDESSKSGLVAALVFGVMFLLLVIGLVSHKVSEARRRHQYTKLDYLINGMYVDT